MPRNTEINMRFIHLSGRVKNGMECLARIVMCAAAFPLAIALSGSGCALKKHAPVSLVETGATSYVIYHDAAAAGSVRYAAGELQRIIKTSTGAELAVVTNPAAKMICLGANDVSLSAGYSVADLPDDAFRIATRGDNIYIVGKDSPRNKAGWGGKEVRGTFNGTCAFLEKYAGVRWLEPGERGIAQGRGEDIPQCDRIVVPPVDITEKPSFPVRGFSSGMTGRQDWHSRLGGGGWNVSCNHNWAAFPPRSVLRAHPEYMALMNGKRMPVPADDRAPFAPKYCTSDPGLIKAYAEGVIDWLERNPNQRFASICPTDGGGWCECPRCQKLMIRGPSPQWGNFGGYSRSVTPLILKFYNDVAKIVGARLPDRYVCGIVYYDYAFPPDPMPRMEPNLALVLAPLHHYGMTRYKPEYRLEFEQLCESWGRAVTNMGYYAASTWMRNGIGAPLGPSLSILKHTFATLRKNNFKIIYYYDLPWSMCGVHNYIVAKLMWNAEADVDAIFEDWLNRAYGPGWPAMAQLYRLLDREMEAAKIAAPKSSQDYEMNSDIALNVYLKNYWTIEEFYREAFAKAATGAQRARLAEFGDNLVVLCHVLNEAGVLTNAEKSVFYRSPDAYRDFLAGNSRAVRIMKGAGSEGAITGILVPGQRAITVPRLPAGTPPPRLDGDLSDPAWIAAGGAQQGHAVADKFSLPGGKTPAKNSTRALVIYDDKHLYVSFRCADTKVVAQAHEKDDDGIRGGDFMELFLSAGSGDPEGYLCLAINPLNAVADARFISGSGKDKSAGLEFESAAGQGEGYWAAEIRIPFKALGPAGSNAASAGPPAGGTWRVNMVRHDEPGGETSSWSPLAEDSSLQPSGFGRFYFPQ